MKREISFNKHQCWSAILTQIWILPPWVSESDPPASAPAPLWMNELRTSSSPADSPCRGGTPAPPPVPRSADRCWFWWVRREQSVETFGGGGLTGEQGFTAQSLRPQWLLVAQNGHALFRFTCRRRPALVRSSSLNTRMWAWSTPAPGLVPCRTWSSPTPEAVEVCGKAGCCWSHRWSPRHTRSRPGHLWPSRRSIRELKSADLGEQNHFVTPTFTSTHRRFLQNKQIRFRAKFWCTY